MNQRSGSDTVLLALVPLMGVFTLPELLTADAPSHRAVPALAVLACGVYVWVACRQGRRVTDQGATGDARVNIPTEASAGAAAEQPPLRRKPITAVNVGAAVVLLAVLVGGFLVDLGEGFLVLFLVGVLLYDRSRLRTRTTR